jgi:hypothetical protein
VLAVTARNTAHMWRRQVAALLCALLLHTCLTLQTHAASNIVAPVTLSCAVYALQVLEWHWA